MKKIIVIFLFIISLGLLYAQNYLLQFDGVDDYITVPGDDHINTAGPYKNRTIEAWFRADTLIADTIQTIYEEGGKVRGFHIFIRSDTLYAGAWNINETSWNGTWYHHTVFKNKWYHVALVLNNGTNNIENNKLFAYLNGYEFSSGNKKGTKVYKHPGDIHIARHGHTRIPEGELLTTGGYFHGRLNEIRVWNSARSQQKIKDNMYDEISASSPGLVAYWKFNDGSGSTATDATSNNIDGTLTNMDLSTCWISGDLPPEPDVLPFMFDEISDNKSGELSTTGFIEIYNPSSGTANLGGYKIIVGTNPTGTEFIADSPEVSYTIPSGTTVTGRGVITVGNGASLSDFNSAWGTSLTSSTYLSGSSNLLIASGKAYALDNGSKSVVDISPEVGTGERRIVEENDLWGDTDTASNGSPGSKDSEQDLPLPVILGEFFANFTNENITLYWVTMSEENNSFWNVYRSTSENFGQSEKINPSPIPGANTTSQQTTYNFTDKSQFIQGQTYYYWLESVDLAGDSFLFGPVSVNIQENNQNNTPQLAEEYGLIANFPNPFNPTTTIKFRLKDSGNAQLVVYNIKGEKVATIFDGNVQKDKEISTVWNANNVPTGIYLYKLISKDKTYVKKMILMK